jgi:hypothetical protein
MGYNEQRLEVLVTARTSAHNSERDQVEEALWRSLASRVETAVDEIVSEPEYAAIGAMRI